MSGDIKEFSGQFTDVVAVTELRGSYPNVPIAPDVDYSALVAGDPDPVFVSLPIGKANSTSGNKRYYDEAWLQELERQTLAGRPIGLFGHLSDAQRATEFPPEAVHWVGAIQENGVLWGKAYVVPGEARDRLRRYKAQGKSIATSIDATANGVWDESLQAYRMDAKTLKLAQIDIAPADRAGIAALARVPVLTTEMQQDEPPATDAGEKQETDTVDKLQVINEMTADDARLLPEPVRAAVLATVQAPPEVAQLAGIRELLGLDAKADVAAAITEMRRVQTEQAKQAVATRITELVTAGVKIEDARPLVTELVQARNPQTPADAETAYNAVIASESVTKMLAARVVETMGPPQRTPVAGKNGNRYFVIPEEK